MWHGTLKPCALGRVGFKNGDDGMKGMIHFAAALLAAGLGCSGAVSAQALDWQSKVEPQLLLKTQDKSGVADFMVVIGDEADLSGAAQLKRRADKGRYVVQALKAAAARSQPAVLAALRARGLSAQPYWIANAIATRGTRADVEALALRADVKSLNWISSMAIPPAGVAGTPRAKADPFGVETGVALVRAPEVWALGFRGQGVVVGDHDIGVQWDHPALKGKYRGWDGTTATHEYNWLNAFPLDPFCTDKSVPCDSNGHGTHTTGTMVGDDGVGNQPGMAPDAQWIACRSLLDPVVGVGTLPTYLTCMEWTIAPYPTGNAAAADPDKAPDVVNNSWGCLEGCVPPVLKSSNDAIKAAGIIQVVSAGNDGDTCSTLAFPIAVYESSFTVGATDDNDAMASFSSRGPVLSDLSMRVKPNVVAPGVGTLSSTNDGGYASLSGTSMAGPHVAGLVALILSAEPRLIGRVDEVRHLIEQTAVKIRTDQVCGGTGENDIPNNIFGYGRIDALAAVLARPQLTLAASKSGAASYAYAVTSPDSGKLDLTNVQLQLRLPAGTKIAKTSEPPAATDTAATGESLLRFDHATLKPGEGWNVQVDLEQPADIIASAEADQVSPVSPAPVKLALRDAVRGGRFGGAFAPLMLLLLAGGLLLRRRSR